MNWIAVGITFGIELTIMFILTAGIGELYLVAGHIQKWANALKPRDHDIRDRAEELAAQMTEPLPKMNRQYPYIVLPMILTVFANIYKPFIAPLPFLVGLLFTAETVVYIWKTAYSYLDTDEEMDRLDQEVNMRDGIKSETLDPSD